MAHFVKYLKKIICFLCVTAASVYTLSVRSFALEEWPSECYVLSEGACLMDADTRTVLFEKDSRTSYYPASITKVLTALIVLENCENLSEQVTFSYDAVHIEEENSTIIGASEGDKLSVLDCLYCLLFQSANEVANALAEHVGAKHPELKEDGENDTDVFIKLMNMKLEELGGVNSHFNNPSGLTDENHYTCAYDMCLILAEALKDEEFLDIESHTYWTHAPIARYPDADDPWNTVYPKHSMLKRNSSLYYEGTIAGKTGYTLVAGNTLVTAVKRNGMTLVSCVLNAHANHYNDTIRMMDFGFENFVSLYVSDYDALNSTILSDFSLEGLDMVDSYTIGLDSDAKVTIPRKGSFQEVEKHLDTDANQDSDVSAMLTYTYGDRTVGSAQMRLINMNNYEEGILEASGDPLLAGILEVENAEEISPETGQQEGADQETSGQAESAIETKGQEGTDQETSGQTESTIETKGQAETSSETIEQSETSSETIEHSGDQGTSQKSLSKSGEGVSPISGNIINYAIVVVMGVIVVAVLVGLFKARSNARRRKNRMKHLRRNTKTNESALLLRNSIKNSKKNGKR